MTGWVEPKGCSPSRKDADSIWSTVIPSPPPNLYTYRFVVDGSEVIDPSNYQTALVAGRSPVSVLEIRSREALAWDEQPVPRGTIHIESFRSQLQDRVRSFYVYTPPSYHASPTRRYPTLVLLPGTPGTEAEWVEVGFAERILTISWRLAACVRWSY